MLRRLIVLSSFVLSACGWNGPAEGVPADTVSLAEAPPPVRGGTIEVSRDGGNVLVVDRDRAQVHLLTLSGQDVVDDQVYDFTHDARPEKAVFADGAPLAIVSDSRLVRLEPDGSITSLGGTCAGPRGLAWDGGRSRAWVTCGTGQLVGVSLDGEAPLRLQLSPDLGDIRVAGDELLIAVVRKAEVLKVRATSLQVDDTVSLPQAISSAVTDASGHSSHDLQRTDEAQAALRIVDGPDGPLVLHEMMRNGPEQSAVTITHTSWGGSRTSSSTVTGPCGASALYVAATPVTGATSGRVVLASLPYASDAAYAASRNELAVVTPSALVPSITGPNVVVASLGQQCPTLRPQSVDGQPTAVAYLPDGTLLVQTREPGALFIGGEPYPLSDTSVRDTGHDLFHTAASPSGVPCISCHIDGSTDGHVWDLGNGPRNTTTLRGGLGQTAPYHWDARFSNLYDLFQSHFPGPVHTTVHRDQVAAFRTWVDALAVEPHPEADPSLVDEGRADFAALGCAGCHGADGASPVPQSMDFPDGTWQVPSLADLGQETPLGHDGCADDFGGLLDGDCDFPGHQVSDPQARAALSAFLGVTQN